MNTDNERLHCHKPNCGWLALPRLTGIDPPQLTANPELSGIGVILGFSITAYITVALLIFHYITVYDPCHLNGDARENTNPVDQVTTDFARRYIISWKPTRRFEYAMEKSVLLLSDTQLVTGLAILIAGFSQLTCGISAYHWQIIVYIAWFSSFTFLAAVAFLESYLRANRTLRMIRVFLMCALAGLQIAALLPTGSKNWLDVYGQAGDFYPSLSAQCYYKQLVSSSFAQRGPRIWSMVVSVLVVGLSYVRCGMRLFDPPATLSQKCLQAGIGRCYRRVLYVLERKANQSGLRAAPWMIPYLAFYAILCNVSAIVDVAQSMLGEILWLAGAIAWGSIKLWRTRLLVQINFDISTANTVTFHDRLIAEDTWSFGQTLPIILLLLPIMSMVQSYLDNDAKAQQAPRTIPQGTVPISSKSTTNTSTTGLSTVRVDSSQSHGSTSNDRNRSHPSPSPPKPPSVNPDLTIPISPATRQTSISFSIPKHPSILPRLPRYPYQSFATYAWYKDHIYLQIWQTIMLATYILIIQDITINILGVSFLLRSHVFLLWVFVCIPLASFLHLFCWYLAAAIMLHVHGGAEDWLNGAGDFAYKGESRLWGARITAGEWTAWALKTALKAGLLVFTFLVSQELAGPNRLEFDL